MGDHNTHKMMTSNKTSLTVAISDPIITEGLSFNLAQKKRFKKVLDLSRNVSKCYQPPNRALTFRDILGVIHDHNTERKIILIKKESDIFGLLFLCDGSILYPPSDKWPWKSKKYNTATRRFFLKPIYSIVELCK